MFDKQEIAVLKGMFETYKKDTVLEIRDETNARFIASEVKIAARMDRLELKIDRVASDAAELISDSILPQIDELRREDTRIKEFVGMTK